MAAVLERLSRVNYRIAELFQSPAWRECALVHLKTAGRLVLGGVAVVYLSLVCSCFFLPYTSTNTIVVENPNFYVDTTTGRIKDKFGRERVFHGVNVVFKEQPWLPQLYGNDPQMSFSDYDISILQGLGLNAVRLGVMWPGVHPKKGEVNHTYLGLVKDLVRRLHKADIYTLVDFHQDVFGERFCGEGVPAWLLDDTWPSDGEASEAPAISNRPRPQSFARSAPVPSRGPHTAEGPVSGPTRTSVVTHSVEDSSRRVLRDLAGSLEAKEQEQTGSGAGLPGMGQQFEAGRSGVLGQVRGNETRSNGQHVPASGNKTGNGGVEGLQGGACVGFAVCMKPKEYVESFPEPISPRFSFHFHDGNEGDVTPPSSPRLPPIADVRKQWLTRQAERHTRKRILREGSFPESEQCKSIPWGLYHFTFAVSRAFQDLYENKWGWRDSLASYWAEVAQALKGEEGVLGFDLMNEPWAGDVFLNPLLMLPGMADRLNFEPLYHHLQDAIRKVDASKLIFFEGVTFENVAFGFENVPGGQGYTNMSVISYHYYRPPNVAPRATFVGMQAQRKRLQCGSMLTEFGIPNHRPDWLNVGRSHDERFKPLPGTACLPVRPDKAGGASPGSKGCVEGPPRCAGESAASWPQFAKAWGKVANSTSLGHSRDLEAHGQCLSSVQLPCAHPHDSSDSRSRRGLHEGNQERDQRSRDAESAAVLGAVSGADKAGWLETAEVLELADEHVQSWMAWEYKPFVPITGANYGLFSPDGKGLDRTAQMLFWRTYPVAVAGSIESFTFDPLSSAFNMTYWPAAPTAAETGKGKAATEKSSFGARAKALVGRLGSWGKAWGGERWVAGTGVAKQQMESDIFVCCNMSMHVEVDVSGVQVERLKGGSLVRLRHLPHHHGHPIHVRIAP